MAPRQIVVAGHHRPGYAVENREWIVAGQGHGKAAEVGHDSTQTPAAQNVFGPAAGDILPAPSYRQLEYRADLQGVRLVELTDRLFESAVVVILGVPGPARRRYCCAAYL